MRRKTNEEFINEIKEKSPSIEVIGTYINQRTKIEVRCNLCGNVYFANPISLLMGCGCATCSGVNKKTSEQFFDEIKSKNPNIDIISNYVNSKTKIKVKCKKCDFVWEVTPNSLLSGRGCPKCAGTQRKSNEQFLDEMSKKHPTITVIGKYKNNRTKVLCKCNKCGIEFMGIPHAMLDANNDCPNCKASTGERKIRDWLDKNNIQYVREYCFENCKDVRALPFDFYIENIKTVIEYDGVQHYKPNDFFGGNNTFEITQKHDKIKNTYCKEHNINLLRIPYYEFDNIDTILNNHLAK
ncbi:MAG TPA: hypothetical protein OIL97_04875 [Oscillospiraceae bacterium]|nr:hypothetical protein [Oscillospiraceae bacterium]